MYARCTGGWHAKLHNATQPHLCNVSIACPASLNISKSDSPQLLEFLILRLIDPFHSFSLSAVSLVAVYQGLLYQNSRSGTLRLITSIYTVPPSWVKPAASRASSCLWPRPSCRWSHSSSSVSAAPTKTTPTSTTSISSEPTPPTSPSTPPSSTSPITPSQIPSSERAPTTSPKTSSM